MSGTARIVVDRNGTMWVANETSGTIRGYLAGSTGNVSPTFEIGGSNTQLYWPVGLAIDGSNNIYAAQCAAKCFKSGENNLVFRAGSNGNVAPLRVIQGANTLLGGLSGIAVDSHRRIYVGDGNNNAVDFFAAGANGNVAPLGVIAGSNTGINDPNGVAVNGLGDIYVRQGTGAVAQFAPGSNGNVAPTRVISGGNTMLNAPDVLYVKNGALYAANRLGNSITEYPKNGNGDIFPSREIVGPTTQLDGPSFVFAR